MRHTRRFVALAVLALAATPALAQPSHKQAAPPDRQDRLTSAPSYLPLPPLSSAVVQDGMARGTIVVDAGLDIPDAAMRTRAQSIEPRLRDALRTALSTYANTYYRDRTPPDPVQVARIMQLAVDRTLGAPGARVLLANLVIQRPRR